MIRTLISLAFALVICAGLNPAHAQNSDQVQMFSTIGPDKSAFDMHLETWRANPDDLANFDESPIQALDLPVSPQLRQFNQQITTFMQENDARAAQLRSMNGTILDIYLSHDGQLLFDPVSTPTEHILWKELINDDSLISGDVFIKNTGQPDVPSRPIRTFIAQNNFAAISALPTEVMAHETPSWSTVAIYGKSTGNLPYCTGVIISPSLVLSAAHCFCGEHLQSAGDFTVNVRPQYGDDMSTNAPAARIAAEDFIQYRARDTSYCEHSGTAKERLPYGDIILIKLKRDVPTALTEETDEGLGLISDFSTASVVAPNQSIWSPNSCQFKTIGFGVGRSETNLNSADDANRHMRRDLTYAVETETFINEQPGVIISHFGRTGHAVCPGDSGSGVFVTSKVTCGHDADPFERAVAGVVSKVGISGQCFIADATTGVSMFDEQPTTVTRLDTQEVHDWLKDSAAQIGETVTFVSVPGPATVLVSSE